MWTKMMKPINKESFVLGLAAGTLLSVLTSLAVILPEDNYETLAVARAVEFCGGKEKISDLAVEDDATPYFKVYCSDRSMLAGN